MTTQEHLHRERESHGLLPGECLPHMFLIRPEFLACHKTFPPARTNRLQFGDDSSEDGSDQRCARARNCEPSSSPSSLGPWRISAIGEIYEPFLLYWVRTGMGRIYSASRE